MGKIHSGSYFHSYHNLSTNLTNKFMLIIMSHFKIFLCIQNKFHVLTVANSKLKIHKVSGSGLSSLNQGTGSLPDLALVEDLHVVKKHKTRTPETRGNHLPSSVPGGEEGYPSKITVLKKHIVGFLAVHCIQPQLLLLARYSVRSDLKSPTGSVRA